MNGWGVIGFILRGIQIRLPQQAKFMPELCLAYVAESDKGWWEAIGA
jgi:hypothetical protein